MRPSTLPILAILTLLGCASASKPSPEVAPSPLVAIVPSAAIPAASTEVPSARTPSPWDAEILAIAASYKGYGVIADNPNWAPTDCAAPSMPPSPDTPRLSAAEGTSAHGQKLYYLYAKDRAAYVRTGASNGPVDVGQIVVKEAFAPVELGKDAAPHESKKVVRKGAKAFVPGERTALFVMKKVGRGTPGTDDGWIYATTDAEGKHVTASGKIESCMGCHTVAPHDRLFAKDL